MLKTNFRLLSTNFGVKKLFSYLGNGQKSLSINKYGLRELSSSPLDISGIYPPIATPFDEKEEISYSKLEYNITKWNEIKFKGYVVQGSNGEYAYLTPEERVDMVAKVRNLTPKTKLILAGSGCESTRDTVVMSKKMADAGADALLIVTPCYYKGSMNSSAMESHFTKVADESPVPVILYSVPANTGIDLSAEVIIKLSKHPNIIGLKDSGGDISKLGNVVYRTKDQDFQVLAGSASFLYPALSVGCVGGVCALANILGNECVQLQDLSQCNQHEEAKALQHRLIAPNVGVTRQFGVPGLKAAMDWFGYYGGPTRSPLQPLTSQETTTLKNIFTSSGFTAKNSESEVNEGFILRLRGLPWSASAEDIANFFEDCNISGGHDGIHFTYLKDGRRSGEAYVEFDDKEELRKALAKDKDDMGKRYIELFPCERSEMEWILERSGFATVNSGSVIQMRGLPFSCSVEDIEHFFSGLEIIPDGITFLEDSNGRMTGRASVQFASPKIAEKALSKHKDRIGDRYIEVFKVKGGSKSNYKTETGYCVHMRGLPYEANEQDVLDFFKPHNPVNVFIHYQSDGRASGEADVDFATHDEAKEAMSKDRDTMRHRYIELFLRPPKESQRL